MLYQAYLGSKNYFSGTEKDTYSSLNAEDKEIVDEIMRDVYNRTRQ